VARGGARPTPVAEERGGERREKGEAMRCEKKEAEEEIRFACFSFYSFSFSIIII
jgi:hypothetical protein